MIGQYVNRLATDTRLTVDRYSSDTLTTLNCRSADISTDTGPTLGRYIDRQSTDMSPDMSIDTPCRTQDSTDPAGLLMIKKDSKQSKSCEILDKGQREDKRRQLQKEIGQLRNDYETACEQNEELYDLVDHEEQDELDQWENELTNNVFHLKFAKPTRAFCGNCSVSFLGFQTIPKRSDWSL